MSETAALNFAIMAVGCVYIAISIGIIAAACWLFKYIAGRKSYDYRKNVMNMYVAGKIRKFADNDNLDLEKEEEKFEKYRRKIKNNMNSRDLDDRIEQKLSEVLEEKLDQEMEKKTDKKKK